MRLRFRRTLAACALCLGAVPVAAPAQAGPSQEDRWALLIGIEQYQGRTQDIVGGVGDVSHMSELLTRNGWRVERIRTLTNEQATASAIRGGLEWIASNCGSPSSRCVVHYTGHTKRISTGEGGEGLHEYLWPTDNKFISDTEFAGYMRRLNGHAWINVSACHAAGFDNGISSPKRLFTGASGEHEKAYEHPGWRTSVWNGLLVRDAILEGRGDANGDGNVSLAEAFSYGAAHAPKLTAGQATGPQHPYTAGSNLHDWFPTPQPAGGSNCLLGLICL
ncbi:MAG: caspase family protein [Actinobacteria bacterium]|nr:caspase family protein [Actinomycetota bacterium]